MKNIVIEVLNLAGVKVAQLDEQECECSTTREINKQWNITLNYPIPPSGQGMDKSAYLTAFGACLRVKNLTDSTYQTYVITKAIPQRSENFVLSVQAEGEHKIISDLNKEVIAAQFDIVNMTPTQALTKILGYSSIWTAGTVQPTAVLSINISYETVLSAFQKLIEACAGEYDVNEAAGTISIYTALGSDNKVRILVGKNLKSIQRTYYNRNVVTKLYGVGNGQPPATIAGARHIVSSYASGTGIITCVGNKIVPENDCWNTNYTIYVVTGAEAGQAFTITDCSHGAANDTITIATGESLASGDKFIIRTTGNIAVDFITAPAPLATYGIINGIYKSDFSSVTNLAESPALDGTYTAGVCERWTKTGNPGLSENTTAAYIQYGTKSQKVVGTAAGDGIFQDIITTAGKLYRLSAWIYLAAPIAADYQYPTAYSDTYVKATSYFSANYYQYFATNPALSLTGTWNLTSWICASTVVTNQRFHIDLGSAKIINKIVYENSHTSGANTNSGVRYFTFWGSNSAASFAELTYGTDTGWTQITTDSTLFYEHSASDEADPQSIIAANGNAYRYYAFKFEDNHGSTDYMGVRRIQLQSEVTTGAARLEALLGTDAFFIYAKTQGWQKLEITFYVNSTSFSAIIAQYNDSVIAENSTFYVDAVQCEEISDEKNNGGSFTGNDEKKKGWDATFDRWLKAKDVQFEYACNFIDLYKISPSDYPFDSIALGDTVYMYDEDLGISAVPARVRIQQGDVFRPELAESSITNL